MASQEKYPTRKNQHRYRSTFNPITLYLDDIEEILNLLNSLKERPEISCFHKDRELDIFDIGTLSNFHVQSIDNLKIRGSGITISIQRDSVDITEFTFMRDQKEIIQIRGIYESIRRILLHQEQPNEIAIEETKPFLSSLFTTSSLYYLLILIFYWTKNLTLLAFIIFWLLGQPISTLIDQKVEAIRREKKNKPKTSIIYLSRINERSIYKDPDQIPEKHNKVKVILKFCIDIIIALLIGIIANIIFTKIF
ncbi:hypothetical protein Lepto7376_2164 [[Leptolyngbya] sp. PCC 7376]|uniref:hypothetical protein n=1 Tax=[Leptolyngbya] sp. PCC 7376 TaxID=111781 RepID=UPI00029F12CF|nr:hypothetical protein [[Leptolyngbya] sp. PCC 7376]AFY38459.1 hypothetical protein Lepto7376_2164 [[Leptolyngbya] sp. PCC 7376]